MAHEAKQSLEDRGEKLSALQNAVNGLHTQSIELLQSARDAQAQGSSGESSSGLSVCSLFGSICSSRKVRAAPHDYSRAHVIPTDPQ